MESEQSAPNAGVLAGVRASSQEIRVVEHIRKVPVTQKIHVLQCFFAESRQRYLPPPTAPLLAFEAGSRKTGARECRGQPDI